MTKSRWLEQAARLARNGVEAEYSVERARFDMARADARGYRVTAEADDSEASRIARNVLCLRNGGLVNE